jgi:ABC-2 type transport system permease protein
MLTVLFSSIFFGIYLVWDKKVDFFKEVLAAPLRRTTLFVGKTIGGATDSLIQAALLIILGVFFGVKYTPYSVLILVLYVIFISVGTTSLGLAIGAQMTSFEGFGLINSFFVFPLFFLSGALYPITSLPSYLKILTSINPFTYMVDGMRGAIYPPSTTFHMSFSPILDLGIGLGFMLILIAVGVFSFQHMRS